MVGKDDYAGKEQMWVKHWLLENYLERLIMKVGRRWARFVYIDGYAGPWNSNMPDLSDTSFARALSVMRACQAKLENGGHRLPMHAIFCEKDKQSAARLMAYAKEHSRPPLTIDARHANFIKEVSPIAASLSDTDFAFALIDPTGFSEIAPAAISPLLRKRGVEVLINLMWDHVNRFWKLKQIGPTLDAIFGSNRGNQGTAEMYAAGLRAEAGTSGRRLWASSFPIQRPDKNRTHYHLVYGTHSSVGLLTFDKAAEDTWREHAMMRAEARVRRACEDRPDLFAGEVLDVQVKRETDPQRYRAAWLALLPTPGSEKVINADVMAGLIEECGCLQRDLQDALFALIRDGVVENTASKGKRSKNAVDVTKDERLRRLQ